MLFCNLRRVKIPGESLHLRAPFLHQIEGNMRTSNLLPGRVKHVKVGSVTGRFTVEVGEFEIESVMTRQSAEELHLQPGDRVMVVVKPTDVVLRRAARAAAGG